MAVQVSYLMRLLSASRGTSIGFLTGTVTNAATTLILPYNRELNYQANAAFKNVVPETKDLLDTYYRNSLRRGTVQRLLGWHGVDWTDRIDKTNIQLAWDTVIELSRPWISPDQALSWYRKGYIDRSIYDDTLRRSGLSHHDFPTILRNDSEQLSVEQGISLYYQRLITNNDLTKVFEVNGYVDPAVQAGIMQVSNTVAPQDAIYLKRIGRFSDDDVLETLKRNGYTDPGDREDVTSLYDRPPTPSELVTFALREVWDEATVVAFGYDEEFGTLGDFVYWMNVTGMGGSPVTPANPGTSLRSWAQAYWRAHWRIPSPTQGYQFLHRLRPDRIGRYQAIVPGVQPWTMDDMRRLLKVDDYPAPFRDRLASISYNVLTRVDIRRLYDDGIISEDEVYQQYLDRGYVPDDARAITRFTVTQRAKAIERRNRAMVQKSVLDAYRVGTIDRNTAIQRLQDAGYPPQQTPLALSQIDYDVANKTVAATLRSVRSGFIRWEYGANECKRRLGRIGITPARQDSYVQEWTWERESRGKRATAAQIRQWVVRGVMTSQDAYKRLRSMGYSREDASRIVRLISQDAGVLAARAQVAEARTENARLAAMEREARLMDRQSKRLVASLVRAGTPARLRRWLRLGLVTADQVRTRLELQGWQPDDVQHFIDEAQGSRGSTSGIPQEPTAGQ